MKIKIKKGFGYSDISYLLEKITTALMGKMNKGFYSKQEKHYVDRLQKSYLIEVKIKEVKK